MPSIDVDGDKLHFFDAGEGTPIIFIHGSCGGAGQWGGLSKALSENYRCISLDLFGYGASEDWPLSRTWSNADDERAIDAILDLLDQPVHLIIHSAGGLFSFPTVKNRRDQLLSITYFEPTFFNLLGQENNPLFAEPKAMSDNFRAAIDEGNLDKAMASFVDVWARQDGTWESLPDPVKDMMKKGANRLYHEWVSPWAKEPQRQFFATLDLPVLLFLGSDTLASMQRVCEILQTDLPNCRYLEIEGAGHMAPFTHVKEALPEVTRFLSAVDGE